VEEQKRSREGQAWSAEEQAAFRAGISERCAAAPPFLTIQAPQGAWCWHWHMQRLGCGALSNAWLDGSL
jgi:hypothetical protein